MWGNSDRQKRLIITLCHIELCHGQLNAGSPLRVLVRKFLQDMKIKLS